VLGIFGREDLFLACYWLPPESRSPVYNAFKLYRNCDGQGHGFGEQALALPVPHRTC